ncbi:MAG: bacteriophage T4 gp5 trimerisation domain-containing protein [Terriglobales bacterium]
MAAVFDGKTKVGRAVADPGTDDMLPNPGSLVLPAIATPVALSGTIGTHCMLAHGDRWEQIEANRTENVLADLKTTITGNQNEAIQGNRTVNISQDQKETVAGQCQQVIVGPHLVTNFDVRNETRLGTHAQTHGEFEWVNDEDGKIHWGVRQYTFYAFTFEFEAFHTEVGLNHLEIKGNHPYFSSLDTSVSAFRFQNTELNAGVSLTDEEIAALKAHVKALEPKLGAAEPKAVAVVPLAGADPNPTPLI